MLLVRRGHAQTAAAKTLFQSSPPQASASSPPRQANARKALPGRSFRVSTLVLEASTLQSVPGHPGSLLCYKNQRSRNISLKHDVAAEVGEVHRWEGCRGRSTTLTLGQTLGWMLHFTDCYLKQILLPAPVTWRLVMLHISKHSGDLHWPYFQVSTTDPCTQTRFRMLQSTCTRVATRPSAEKKTGGKSSHLWRFSNCLTSNICRRAQMKWDPCCADVTVSEQTDGVEGCLSISGDDSSRLRWNM